ncbi:hypothetical protein LV780_18070 [Cereibacter azotoformans]|uniref:hypothetical protein n=1 Tax=Cereibacter azotoformans TaxID=43057 RepID=UPI000E35CA3A|nr:hypothetical protein [Cereibacter azotoformans]AXQ95512.1 hypothetical protein D0Z66_17195 [Cereibacter sphaeroides]UIJ32244.1 hypothetical protein LV780_18070 [Cereibacter azotoformans]
MQILPSGKFRLPLPSTADRDVPIASKGHFTGHVVMGSGPGRVSLTESHLETEGFLCLQYRPDVREIFEQVGFEWHDENGEVFDHYFDCVAVHTDGSEVAYTFKASRYATPAFLTKMGMIKAQAMERGFVDDVRLVVKEDLDPVELHNAWLLHGMRHPDPEADTRAAAAVGALDGVAGLDELTRRIGLGSRGLRALFRLIAQGRLLAAEPGRFTPLMKVIRGQEPEAMAA